MDFNFSKPDTWFAIAIASGIIACLLVLVSFLLDMIDPDPFPKVKEDDDDDNDPRFDPPACV